jgi:PTH1 family peptidyl-tRNA hydrolase
VKLIVGLGNPGRDYRWTRHNVGFLLVELLAEKNGIDLTKRGLKSIYGRGKIGRQDVILAKPQTFMNLSGEAVQRLLRFFKIPPEDLIVLHDDLDLPFGKIRIRLQGGAGGHKGIKSIIESLGVDVFVRFKVGIGRPGKAGQDPADFVLEPLSGGEREELKEMVNRNAEAVEILLLEGPQEAMNRFHKDGGDKDA